MNIGQRLSPEAYGVTPFDKRGDDHLEQGLIVGHVQVRQDQTRTDHQFDALQCVCHIRLKRLYKTGARGIIVTTEPSCYFPRSAYGIGIPLALGEAKEILLKTCGRRFAPSDQITLRLFAFRALHQNTLPDRSD